MEITEDNFNSVLPVVLKAIENADFLSFDCEFTGLGEGASMILPFDTPALVYAKAKENLGSFTVVQFGLCTFRYDATNQKFLHRAFNFYVFPRLPKELSGRLRKKSTPYQSFNCQADSLEFLAKQKFDFNKWIWNGVGFLKKSFVDELKDDLIRKYNWRAKSEKVVQPLIKIPDAHKEKLNSYLSRVEEFFKSEATEYYLENIQVFEKRLLINLLENKYGLTLFFDSEINANKEYCLKIKKCKSEAEYKQCIKQEHEKKLALMDDAAGFCKVIMAISESKKPLVGHNMYLDLLHSLKAFCCELPQSYAEFKLLVNKWFPRIIDTKVLGSQVIFKKHVGFANSLFQLYKRTERLPFTPPFSVPEEEGYSYEHCTENQHEAGYDAFLTGLIFIGFSDFWATSKNKMRNTKDIPWDLIMPLYNKLAPGRVIDMPCFDLNLTPEADMCPDRSYVFHLCFSSEDWVNDNIVQLFSPFGGIQIAWIDDTSCFVTLRDRSQVKLVLSNLVTCNNCEERKWKVKPSVEYFDEQEKLLLSEVNNGCLENGASNFNFPLKKIKLNLRQ